MPPVYSVWLCLISNAILLPTYQALLRSERGTTKVYGVLPNLALGCFTPKDQREADDRHCFSPLVVFPL